MTENPPLLRAVAAFNRPSRGEEGQEDLESRIALPEGWKKNLEDGVAGKLEAFLESALAARPGLWNLWERPDSESDFWDFEPEPWRLMLLGTDDFTELAVRFGAAAWGARLSLAVGGPAVRTMRASLGGDLLDWAVGRGRLWLGNLAGIHRQGLSLPRNRAELGLTGLRAVNVAWGELPAKLAGKAPERLWKGPPLTSPESSTSGKSMESPGDLASRTFQRLKRILVAEVAPSWRACFN